GGVAVSSGASGDSRITPGPGGNVHVENKKMTMAGFASAIDRYSDRPVIEMTGLTGAYEMEFDVSGEEVRTAARAHGFAVPPPAEGSSESASDPAGVSLAASLRRLGLRLEPRKAPVEVIVIDAVEKVPTEN
ncbi:MAG TPA: TIGR03435 family protein, partial [Candidatus Acidoferrales bacterium]|nr:TIGR03435 family protein [Candidatus Acidoferrales bacterium]